MPGRDRNLLVETWDDRATFMRRVGATHATWDENGAMTSLTLAPAAAERPAGPAVRMADFHARAATRTRGEAPLRTPAQRQHDIMFAASSTRPVYEAPPAPPSAVPRAVRAKEEAARRGETKRRS